jgi:L-ribulose-5-phosphate 4-epimerase
MSIELSKLEEEVYMANMGLYEENLVVGTQGNVSGIDRETGLVVIKPSGISYKNLKISDMVTVNLNGEKIKGDLKPSVDLAHHLFLYKNIENIGAVVHTHSTYATIFAIAEKSIPCLSTGHADIFGGEIPVTPYSDNKGNKIGETILKFYKQKCPSIIAGRHGVFAFGSSPQEALKIAILTEHVAQTSFGGLVLGKLIKDKEILPLPDKEIEKWYSRYHGGGYGQEKTKP